MKQFLVLVTVLFVSQSLLATSIIKEDILSLRVDSLLEGGASTIITINSMGQVFGEQCRAIYPNPCVKRNFRPLRWSKVSKVYRLINQASNYSLQFPEDFPITCMAVPGETARYTAGGNRVLLSVGSRPCGKDVISRMGEPTKDLMKILNGYLNRMGEE